METRKLEGPALDYWVAKAQGKKYIAIGAHGGCWAGVNSQDQDGEFFSPSTRWDQGGPIIETKCIWIEALGNPTLWRSRVGDMGFPVFGPTALVAAMRALVLDVFGEEVPRTP